MKKTVKKNLPKAQPGKAVKKTMERTPTQQARFLKKQGYYPISDQDYMRMYNEEDTSGKGILFQHNRTGSGLGYEANSEKGKAVLSEYDRLYKRKNPNKTPYKNMQIPEKGSTMRIASAKAVPVPMQKVKPEFKSIPAVPTQKKGGSVKAKSNVKVSVTKPKTKKK